VLLFSWSARQNSLESWWSMSMIVLNSPTDCEGENETNYRAQDSWSHILWRDKHLKYGVNRTLRILTSKTNLGGYSRRQSGEVFRSSAKLMGITFCVPAEALHRSRPEVGEKAAFVLFWISLSTGKRRHSRKRSRGINQVEWCYSIRDRWHELPLARWQSPAILPKS
jgi:hypothetical protein